MRSVGKRMAIKTLGRRPLKEESGIDKKKRRNSGKNYQLCMQRGVSALVFERLSLQAKPIFLIPEVKPHRRGEHPTGGGQRKKGKKKKGKRINADETKRGKESMEQSHEKRG